MAQFECIQCEHAFASEKERPRCPKCMRVHGVRVVADLTRSERSGRARGIAALASLLVVFAVAVAWWTRSADLAGSAGERHAEVDVADALAGLGSEHESLAGCLHADEALAAWAVSVAESGAPLARASAIIQALRDRERLGFETGSLTEPRAELCKGVGASENFDEIKDKGRPVLYPLQVSVVVTGALRSLDVSAAVVEILGVSGLKSPLDPSGVLGYFGVVVDDGTGARVVFDPYGGRDEHPLSAKHQVLTDSQVVAAALGLQAITRLSAQGNAALALREVQVGLKLHRNSPVLRSIRAAALSANGGLNEAEQATRSALQLRPDAARHNQLATYLLERGRIKEATLAVGKALQLSPGFASAHLVLAGAHMAQGQLDEARQAVAQAEQLDAQVPGLLLTHAQLHAASGDIAGAVTYAERALAQQPAQPQLHLSLGRLYLAAGREEDARSSARRAIELAPKERRAQMRKVVVAVLGEGYLPDVEQ